MKTIKVKRLFDDTISVSRDLSYDDETYAVGEVVILKNGDLEKQAFLEKYVNGWVASFVVI